MAWPAMPNVGQAIEANCLIIILIGLLIYLCHMSVRVITGVPDRVLNWIGGGVDSLGAAKDMQTHVNQVFAAVSSRTQGGRSARY